MSTADRYATLFTGIVPAIKDIGLWVRESPKPTEIWA